MIWVKKVFMGLQVTERNTNNCIIVHPLHSYMLLYIKPMDSRAVLHTFNALQDILSVNPWLLVSSLATTSLSSPSLPRSHKLIQLLARHRQSVFGKGFTSALPADSTTSYRSSMFLEGILFIALYYIRAYYPSLSGLSEEEVLGNREIQLAGVSTLARIINELVSIVKANGKAFGLYMMDPLTRCKVQKVVLHSLLSGVHCLANINTDCGFTQLVLILVMLEEVINRKKYEESVRPNVTLTSFPLMKYQVEQPLCSQPMFLAAILAVLKQPHLKTSTTS